MASPNIHIKETAEGQGLVDDSPVAMTAPSSSRPSIDTSAPATLPNNDGDNEQQQQEPPSLSKNQQKKRKRWQYKLEVKRRRKEQDKAARHARARAAGRDIVQEQQQQQLVSKQRGGHQRTYQRQQWEQHKVPLMDASFRVCIDCSFDASMTAKEINSLAMQVRFCYARNKRNKHPCHLAVTSVMSNDADPTAPSLRRQLENVAGHEEWKHWGLTLSSWSLEQYYEQRQLQSIVYLTSDSETVLTGLDNSKIYVIGGIVDRNRLRRAAIHRAEGLGLATARLPIDEHLQALKTTRVMTCNHVFELLLHARNGDWKGALLKVLPQRKGVQPKDDDNDASAEIASVVRDDEHAATETGAIKE